MSIDLYTDRLNSVVSNFAPQGFGLEATWTKVLNNPVLSIEHAKDFGIDRFKVCHEIIIIQFILSGLDRDAVALRDQLLDYHINLRNPIDPKVIEIYDKLLLDYTYNFTVHHLFHYPKDSNCYIDALNNLIENVLPEHLIKLFDYGIYSDLDINQLFGLNTLPNDSIMSVLRRSLVHPEIVPILVNIAGKSTFR